MQVIRLIYLTLFGGILFCLPALGWIKLLEVTSQLFPNLLSIANNRFIQMIAILWGLLFLLLPFYTLLYFHNSKAKEVLGFKTPLTQK